MAARAPGRAVITPITSAMINRIGPQLGRALQDAQAQRATTGNGDFYVLSGAFGSVAITATFGLSLTSRDICNCACANCEARANGVKV